MLCWLSASMVPSARTHQRLGVAGAHHRQAVVRRVGQGVDRGDQLVDVQGLEDPVEAAHQGVGARVDRDQGPHRRAHLGHDRGGLDPAAHHVADEHGEPAAVERDEVVEVAARVGASGREVAHRGGPARPARGAAAGSTASWSSSATSRTWLCSWALSMATAARRAISSPNSRSAAPNRRPPSPATQVMTPKTRSRTLSGQDMPLRSSSSRMQPQVLLVLGAQHQHLVGHVRDEVALARSAAPRSCRPGPSG